MSLTMARFVEEQTQSDPSLISLNLSGGCRHPPDFFVDLYPDRLPVRVIFSGTRTSKGTSHPITCGGCYHAQVMAGGESQLSVVIADRCEPIFPKLISRYVPPSLAVSTGHGVSFGLAIPVSSLSVRGVLIFQRTCIPDGVKLLPTRYGEEDINIPSLNKPKFTQFCTPLFIIFF